MRHRILTLAALLALAVVFAPRAARAETITPLFFDGFEADKGDVLDSSLINWNVTAGSIDVLSAGNICGPAAGNYSNCLDLDGTGLAAGKIQTKATFALDPGIYRLSFDLAGANRKWPGSQFNTVLVSLGSFFGETFTMGQYDPFQTQTRDIIVDTAGTAKISFDHSGADWIGLLLDNVSLVRVTQPEVTQVPEPGAFELIACVMGLAFWRFRGTAAKLLVRG